MTEKTVSEIMSGLTAEQTKKAFEEVYGTVEPIEEMSDETEVKEVQVKQKKMSFNDDLKFRYEFSETVDENSGEIQFNNFTFSIFQGMYEAYEQIEREYQKIKSQEGKYSKQYLKEARNEAFIEILQIKEKYRQKYRDQLKELREPIRTQKTLSYSEEQTNELKRLSNILVAKHFLENCTVSQIADLYHQNSSVYDVTLMIQTKLDSITRDKEEKEHVKREAEKLKREIQADITKKANPDFFLELDKIEYNLDFIFNKDTFPIGIEKGMTGIQYKKVLA